MKKEYIKNYLGIVIQNNDPLKRGRVKVWVPHVDMSVYTKWNEEQKNKKFIFPGHNNYSDLTIEILDQLKAALPWAETAMPLVGSGNSSGFYNAATDRGSISEKAEYLSENPPDRKWAKDAADEEEGRAKKESGRWKDLKKDELDDLKKKDAKPEEFGEPFPEPKDDEFVKGRKAASYYKETHVLDAFAPSGDTLLNNYSNPYGNIYKPMAYTNAANGSFSIPNVGSHVWVFFENGDPLKPVIFAVSYGKEDWRSIYDSNNDETSIGESPDYPGKFENGLHEDDDDFKEALDDNVYRGRYSLSQRGGSITIVNTYDREILNLTHYSGSFKEFNNYTTTEFAAHNDQKLVLADSFKTVNGNSSSYVGRDYIQIIKGNVFQTFGDPKNTKAPLEQIKKLMKEFHVKYNQPFEIKRSEIKEFGDRDGKFVDCPTCQKVFYTSLINRADTVTQSRFECSCSYETKLENGEHLYKNLKIDKDGCLTCNGTGVSPSTQDGKWKLNPDKQEYETAIVDLQKKLFEYEKLLGKGGDVVSNYGKNLIVNIGSEMHDFISFREDPIGKLVPDGAKIGPDTVYQKLAPAPLIERVSCDVPHTGSYHLNIGFKHSVLVGSGGISYKTTGPVDISGSIATVTGKQVIISADKEVLIEGGHRANISAEIISFVPHRRNRYAQVFVGGNLEVDRNTIIRGGLHVEGEVSLHHISAPIEYQATETEVLASHICEGVQIGYIKSGAELGKDSRGFMVKAAADIPVYGKCLSEMQVTSRPHFHIFKNLPLKLFNTSKDVRIDAMPLNEPHPKLAKLAVFDADVGNKFTGTEDNATVVRDPVQSTKFSDSILDEQLNNLGIVLEIPDNLDHIKVESITKEGMCTGEHSPTGGLSHEDTVSIAASHYESEGINIEEKLKDELTHEKMTSDILYNIKEESKPFEPSIENDLEFYEKEAEKEEYKKSSGSKDKPKDDAKYDNIKASK
jgi:hypothetical protein